MVGEVPGFLIAEVGGDVIGTLTTLDLVAGIPARVWLLTSQGCMHKFPRCFEGLFYEPVDWCCVTLAPLKKNHTRPNASCRDDGAHVASVCVFWAAPERSCCTMSAETTIADDDNTKRDWDCCGNTYMRGSIKG